MILLLYFASFFGNFLNSIACKLTARKLFKGMKKGVSKDEMRKQYIYYNVQVEHPVPENLESTKI